MRLRHLILTTIATTVLVVAPAAASAAQWTTPVPHAKTKYLIRYGWDASNKSDFKASCVKKSMVKTVCHFKLRYVGADDSYNVRGKAAAYYGTDGAGHVTHRTITYRRVHQCKVHAPTVCFNGPKYNYQDHWNPTTLVYDQDDF